MACSRRALKSLIEGPEFSFRNIVRSCTARFFCEHPSPRLSAKAAIPPFGVLLDIDGVLVRGRKPIPGAREALEMLRQSEVPTVFLTNGGCESEKEAAERLSDKIGFEVREEQMVLSHTPLKMFDWLHNKHVLVSGQLNIKEIVKGYGFRSVSDIEDIRRAYPLLDMVDRERRFKPLRTPPEELPPIEAILLLGEPVRWETHLQLIIDILVTNGNLLSIPQSLCKKRIPVIAANTDLIYMSEVPLPRFGHGAFLLNLEVLYKKLTGQELVYTEFLGKPFISSYKYAEHCLYQSSGSSRGQIKSLYAVGDNLDTDIYGANMCNEYVKAFHESNGSGTENQLRDLTSRQEKHSAVEWSPEVKNIESILVQTGVSLRSDNNLTTNEGARYLHRDLDFQPRFRRAKHVVENIADAVELILKQEQECS